MAHAFIAVGSNLGDREGFLVRARTLLDDSSRIRFMRASSVYETDPVGGGPQGKYLNAVWEIETDLAPAELLGSLLAAEKALGRVRTAKNAPRTIDLDLLLYDDLVLETPGLTLPHPRLHERSFVLVPLAELAPEAEHPVLEKTVRQLLEESLANHS